MTRQSRTLNNKQVQAYLLNLIPRNQLRRYASALDVRRGNTKQDLINNLMKSNSTCLDVTIKLV